MSLSTLNFRTVISVQFNRTITNIRAYAATLFGRFTDLYQLKINFTHEGLRDKSADVVNGRPGFNSREGQGLFLFVSAPRPALKRIQTPIKWITVSVSPGVKRPVREADHSPPSSAQVAGISPFPHMSIWRGD
jgi:hypothetical protein